MDEGSPQCPICLKNFPTPEIEVHVNKCIFLNSTSGPSTTTTEDSKTNKVVSKKRRSSSPCALKIATTAFGALNNKNGNLTSPQKKQKFEPKSPILRATDLNRDDTSESLSFTVPLAKQLQPKTLDEFIGQSQILGPGSVLRTLLERGEVPSMILWGPPGCGKTSLSAVIQTLCKNNEQFKLRFTTLCAATSGVKDVQTIVSTAKMQAKCGMKTILFMDEIHRFNKKQQDIFLLHVEKGDIILIGATTENPSFSINNALLSRCRVVVLNKLESCELCSILEKAARRFGVRIEDGAVKWLADVSDGDARIALSNLQLALQSHDDKNVVIRIADIEEKIKRSHLMYDRKGEEHYNIISAMHKSIRASDPDGALYWTTRMIMGGEDPMYIARRMVRAASEDIGNADPNALQLAVSTMQGCHLLGMPECDVLLAQCAIYLARAPKSREADSALAKAKQVIRECKGAQPDVPLHLRNAPTKLMKNLGYGRVHGGEYNLMPVELEGVTFFS